MDAFGPLRYQDGLAWRETGGGMPFVLLHGGSGSRTHWIRNVAALKTRFAVVTVDLPGFGESSTPNIGMQPHDYVRWFADALLATVGDRPFHMAAFSFGAALGCAALALHRFALRGLTLLGPGGFGNPVGRRLGLESRTVERDGSDEGMRSVVAANLGRVMLVRKPSPHDEVVDLQRTNLENTRYDSRAISLRETLVRDLERIDAPVQVLWGDGDQLAYPSVDARMEIAAAALRRGRLAKIGNAGHWVQYEASDAVNRELLAFHEEKTDVLGNHRRAGA